MVIAHRLPMRILIHDYAGHPFQIQLSRELASRGHEVRHLYAGYNQTPRGALAIKDGDPQTFDVCGVFIRQPLNKDNFIKRWLQEREYGRAIRPGHGSRGGGISTGCHHLGQHAP